MGAHRGALIGLMGEGGKFSPLCWQSKKIRRVMRCTLAGKTLALSDGIENAIFLTTLFSELTTGNAELNPPQREERGSFEKIQDLQSDIQHFFFSVGNCIVLNGFLYLYFLFLFFKYREIVNMLFPPYSVRLEYGYSTLGLR